MPTTPSAVAATADERAMSPITVFTPDAATPAIPADAFFAPSATSVANCDMSPRTSTHTVPACAISHPFPKNDKRSSGVLLVERLGLRR